MAKGNRPRSGSYIAGLLRHHPERENLRMDKNGWVDTDALVKACNLTKEKLDEIVETNNKKRFEYNDDESKIRARQGHSVKVDVGLNEVEPPEVLYHGTAQENKTSIMTSGINSGSRQHVHLSENMDTATNVGSRHGEPIVLKVRTKEMHDDGFKFYLSRNNVWLTDHVPPKYLYVG